MILEQILSRILVMYFESAQISLSSQARDGRTSKPFCSRQTHNSERES